MYIKKTENNLVWKDSVGIKDLHLPRVLYLPVIILKPFEFFYNSHWSTKIFIRVTVNLLQLPFSKRKQSKCIFSYRIQFFLNASYFKLKITGVLKYFWAIILIHKIKQLHDRS